MKPVMCTKSPVPSLRAGQLGLTLIELVVAIVVIGVGVAGVLSAFNVAVLGSADPLPNKQAISAAEALLEEVELAPFTYCDPDDPIAATATDPSQCTTKEDIGKEGTDARPFDNVSDYDGLTLNPITDVSGAAVPGLAGYSATIAVANAALNGIAADESLLITVTVTAPGGRTYALQGYRTRYAPNALP